MVGAGIITAELLAKLSMEAAKVLQTYLQTNSAKDISSFVEWGKVYNISAKSIAEIVAMAYKSDVDIIQSTNDTINHLLILLEKCYTSSNSQTDRDRIFSLIERINNLLIETETQTIKMKKAKQNFSFGAIGSAMLIGTATVGLVAVDFIFNKGKVTKSGAIKNVVKNIFKK